MGDFNPFEMFKKALSELDGMPDGRTELEVKTVIEEKYARIFQAFREYEQIGKYRSSSFSVVVTYIGADKVDYKCNYSINVTAPWGFQGGQLELNQTEIRPTIDYLKEHSPEKRGYWLAEEMDEFIEFLGHYFISLFKPRSA